MWETVVEFVDKNHPENVATGRASELELDLSTILLLKPALSLSKRIMDRSNSIQCNVVVVQGGRLKRALNYFSNKKYLNRKLNSLNSNQVSSFYYNFAQLGQLLSHQTLQIFFLLQIIFLSGFLILMKLIFSTGFQILLMKPMPEYRSPQATISPYLIKIPSSIRPAQIKLK